jgi:hypothetical protein
MGGSAWTIIFHPHFLRDEGLARRIVDTYANAPRIGGTRTSPNPRTTKSAFTPRRFGFLLNVKDAAVIRRDFSQFKIPPYFPISAPLDSHSDIRITIPRIPANTPALLNLYIDQTAEYLRTQPASDPESAAWPHLIDYPPPDPRKLLNLDSFSLLGEPSRPIREWLPVPADEFHLSFNATVFDIELFAPGPGRALETSDKASMFGAKYKKVARRTFPVSTATPEEFRIVRRSPPDILASM